MAHRCKKDRSDCLNQDMRLADAVLSHLSQRQCRHLQTAVPADIVVVSRFDRLVAMEVNTSRWNTIYPAYLNSNRTTAEGRRVAKKKSCADPRIQEIKDVLEATGSFQVVAEPNKTYPRELDKETPAHRGRVRYQMVKESDRLNSKKEILVYLGEMIPRLKTRTQKASNPNPAAEPAAGAPGKKKKSKK